MDTCQLWIEISIGRHTIITMIVNLCLPPLGLFQDKQSILTVVEFVSVIEELHLVEQIQKNQYHHMVQH